MDIESCSGSCGSNNIIRAAAIEQRNSGPSKRMLEVTTPQLVVTTTGEPPAGAVLVQANTHGKQARSGAWDKGISENSKNCSRGPILESRIGSPSRNTIPRLTSSLANHHPDEPSKGRYFNYPNNYRECPTFIGEHSKQYDNEMKSLPMVASGKRHDAGTPSSYTNTKQEVGKQSLTCRDSVSGMDTCTRTPPQTPHLCIQGQHFGNKGSKLSRECVNRVSEATL